jgi:casein kinase II subunit beta
MLLMVYPQMIPGKGQPNPNESRRDMVVNQGGASASAAKSVERYEPRLFGFKVNEEARLARWRTAKRDA